MNILVAGASGLVGGRLVPRLRAAQHRVQRLVRRSVQAPDEIAWNPTRGQFDTVAMRDVDACINLAGENIAAGRWTNARREQIFRSRVDATRTLVTAMTQAAHKPTVLLSASAVGFYGDRGDEILTENSGIGTGFLPEVCLAWETHAENAAREIG